MSNTVTLIITHQQTTLGSVQLCYEAEKYHVVDGQQIIALKDGTSLTRGELTLVAQCTTPVAYKPYQHIAEPDPTLARLRNLASSSVNTTCAQDSLSFLNTSLPLTNALKKPQKLTLLDQYFQPPRGINEQLVTSKPATELAPKVTSSGNILRDLGLF